MSHRSVGLSVVHLQYIDTVCMCIYIYVVGHWSKPGNLVAKMACKRSSSDRMVRTQISVSVPILLYCTLAPTMHQRQQRSKAYSSSCLTWNGGYDWRAANLTGYPRVIQHDNGKSSCSLRVTHKQIDDLSLTGMNGSCKQWRWRRFHHL